MGAARHGQDHVGAGGRQRVHQAAHTGATRRVRLNVYWHQLSEGVGPVPFDPQDRDALRRGDRVRGRDRRLGKPGRQRRRRGVGSTGLRRVSVRDDRCVPGDPGRVLRLEHGDIGGVPGCDGRHGHPAWHAESGAALLGVEAAASPAIQVSHDRSDQPSTETGSGAAPCWTVRTQNPFAVPLV